MKVSIIVPVYNVEPYIKDCFDSIAVQTYQGELECLFIDDCGKDKSVSMLERMIDEYSGTIYFRIIHHEQNKGLSGARNTGIREATGEYLYFLDSDDYIMPDCIEKLTVLAKKYPEVDIVQGNIKTNNDFFAEFLNIEAYGLPEFSNDAIWIKKTILLRKPIPVTSWNKLISTEFIRQNNLFFVEGILHEDEMWIYDASKVIKSIAFCLDQTYFYRIRSESIITSCNVDKKMKSWTHILERMIQKVDPVCKKEQIQMIYHLLISLYLQLGSPCAKELGKYMVRLSDIAKGRKILMRYIMPHLPYFLLRRRTVYSYLDKQADSLF